MRASGAHLGAVLDPDGEHLTLIDDAGHVLTDEQALLALLTLVSGHLLGDTVALPVTVTSHAEVIAAAHGVRVRRTKLATSALMDAASEPGVGFAGQHRRRLHPPGLPARVRRRGQPREGARAARPNRGAPVHDRGPRCRAPHLAHETVVTPWEQKGMVMRSLVEMSKDREVQLDRRREGPPRRRVGAGPARSGGAGHPRLGRGRAPTPRRRRSPSEYARRIRQLLR